MTESDRPLNLQQAWLIAGVAVLAVIAAFGDTMAEMFRLWISIDQFNHCLLIAPASLWMIWRRRRELAATPARISPAGLATFVLFAGIWALGALGRTAIVQHAAAVALLPLSLWAMLGWQIVRVILFPLGYLFFLVPFGTTLIPVLMEFTADMTVLAVRLSGVPIYHDGLFLAIPNGSFRIIEACSGIRMLFAGVAVGALFAYLNFRSYWRRCVFLIFVIALAIIANWLRAYVIVMAAHLSGMDIVADHIWVGYVIFAAVIVIMIWGGSRFSDIGPDDASATSDSTSRAQAATATGATLTMAVLLAATAFATPALTAAGIERAGQRNLEPVYALPETSGRTGWNGPGPYDGLWRPVFIGDTSLQAGSYTGPDGRVDVLVISYQSLSDESELINESNRFFDQERWVLIGQQPGLAANAFGEPVAYLQTRLRNNAGSQLIFRHWYVVDGRPMSNPFAIKLHELKNVLLGRPTMEGAVFVSTRFSSEMSVSDELLDEFMATLIY